MRAIVWAEYRAERLATEDETRVVVLRPPVPPPVEIIDLVSDSSSEEENEAATEPTTRSFLHRQYQQQHSSKQWPIDVAHINSNQNPENLKLSNTGEVDPCGCWGSCSYDSYLNTQLGYCCEAANCSVGGSCGNKIKTVGVLVLARGDNGYCVKTKR